ncbi:MAG: ATP-binding protein [Erysipelotrichales bacterium]|nr:ATP-binding protein [Erysipelotrichales bacterium]
MKKVKYTEIFLSRKNIETKDWQNLLTLLQKYIGNFKHWKIIITINMNEIRYYAITPVELPTMLYDLNAFTFKTSELENVENLYVTLPKVGNFDYSLIDILDKELVKNREIKKIEIDFFSYNNKLKSKSFIFHEKNGHMYRRRLLFANPNNLLSIDFDKNKRFFYKKTPNYLDIQKVLHLLKSDEQNSLFKIDAFPYLSGNYYLNQSNYNFAKHSLVVGSSGSGKSKLLSLMVNNLNNNIDYKLKYKVVIIDPHASLENDIGGLEDTKIIDFKSNDGMVDLFLNDKNNIVSSSELLLDLFKSLIANQYNAKLERLLRHSINLLLSIESFSFTNLRKLLLELEYRNEVVTNNKKIIPPSVYDFFLTEFNEVRTKSYNETIAPIIAFIDEMELLPVFNQDVSNCNNIADTINNNFLTIFSLDNTALGNKITKTLSGLVMQQIMQIIQSRKIDEQIILIVDEVSVVETPILLKFLAESRKYGLSLILAQQYFDQISEGLKNAIFANVINYYIFRVAKKDAITLAQNITIKLSNDTTDEAKQKLLTDLNDRECVVRINANDILLPAFKAKTVNFASIPRKKVVVEPATIKLNQEDLEIVEKKKFSINNDINLTELLLEQSSGRKNMRGDNDERN